MQLTRLMKQPTAQLFACIGWQMLSLLHSGTNQQPFQNIQLLAQGSGRFHIVHQFPVQNFLDVNEHHTN